MHLLLRQNTEIPINKLMSKVCTSYAKYFNKKYERVGHLWQDRFKAKLISNQPYFLQLVRYINRNHPSYKTFPFSSYQEILNHEMQHLTNLNELTVLSSLNHVDLIKYIDSHNTKDSLQ